VLSWLSDAGSPVVLLRYEHLVADAAMRPLGYGERERYAQPLEDVRASYGIRNLM
jgi:hypothetical protein